MRRQRGRNKKSESSKEKKIYSSRSLSIWFLRAFSIPVPWIYSVGHNAKLEPAEEERGPQL